MIDNKIVTSIFAVAVKRVSLVRAQLRRTRMHFKKMTIFITQNETDY